MYTRSKSKLTELVPPSPSVTPVPEMSQSHIAPELLPTLSEDEDNTPIIEVKSPQVSLAEENPTICYDLIRYRPDLSVDVPDLSK